MLTTKNKIKERAEFLVKNPDVPFLICQNKIYEPVGVSVVMKYKYDLNDMEIIYDKWYVENYEAAKKMGLPGCEHHDQLVKGSGVMVLDKKSGSYIFYGQDAKEIINACEYGRDLSAHIFGNQTTIQR